MPYKKSKPKYNTVLSGGGVRDFLLDILFPNHCPACGRVIGYDIRLCGECLPKLEYLPDLPWQSFFQIEIADDDEDDGNEIENENKNQNAYSGNFDGAVGLFKYDGTAKSALLSLKYRRALGFAGFAAEQLALKLDSQIGRIDLVTAVPMNRVKQLCRGYNQAEEFARALAAQLRKPCDFSLIDHRFSLTSQHDLKNRSQRAETAAKTYRIRKNAKSLKGKRVLICDDVLTTGSTLLNCSRLLKQLGAEKVYAAAICVAKRL